MPLVVVGLYMMGPIGLINWEDLFESFPAFLTITVPAMLCRRRSAS